MYEIIFIEADIDLYFFYTSMWFMPKDIHQQKDQPSLDDVCSHPGWDYTPATSLWTV